MRLGIDFGTTRIVAAVVDRGNYPVVSFEGAEGETRDWYPPLLAVRGEERRYGWEAWQAQQSSDWTIVRSLKRYLDDAGPLTSVEIDGQRTEMLRLLTELASSLKEALELRSSLRFTPGEPLEIMLGVPANANGNQRFLTMEAFRQAGYSVLGLLNEPSAAAIEYTESGRAAPSKSDKRTLLVYDLGGGTFDASLVRTEDQIHSVIASESVPTLGGDDFDIALAEMALDKAGVSVDERNSLTQAEWFRLQEECRQKKEALYPNTRRIVVDLEAVRDDWEPVTVLVADYYAVCLPLVEETVYAVRDLLASQSIEPDALYVTGGGSELPLVPRALRETFGRRVRRGSYTHSATAIGLAIQADEQAEYVLRDTFTRYFGVWREADGGHTILFDPLFAKGTPLPLADDPPITVSRSYHPVHNIGHFRYLECSHRADDGRPLGEITLWEEIFFPFDPELRNHPQLETVDVGRSHQVQGESITEMYACDNAGAVTVTVANDSAGYERRYRLGRWSVPDKPLRPGRRGGRSRRKQRPGPVQ